MSDLKENIKKLLLFLKEKGYDRRRIEQELGLAENSIDQNLARGGTKKLETSLELLKKSILQNAILEVGLKQGSKKQENKDKGTDAPLHDLISSNSKLADAALINAEANKLREEKELRLVQSNAELTAMLKQSGVNPEGTVIIDTSMLMKIRDAIAEIGLSSKKWLTQPEALREAGILLGLHVGDKEKRKGIQTGADKTRTA